MTKPKYVIPSMSDIRSIRWNGLKVASTFSGTGGSCLGYRMAGYKVVWANEFVPSAQLSYKANHDSYLETRDIKVVSANDVFAATGLSRGELDLFDGSPPCQAFSTVGKREKGWGSDKTYEHGASQKNEMLFFEYIRLLKELQPKVFVAENVKGLVIGSAIGFFKEIMAALRQCGYEVESRVLDAKHLGVPQSRQRVIIVGVRSDIAKKYNVKPAFPDPLPYVYSMIDACPWLQNVSISTRNRDTGKNDCKIETSHPSKSVQAKGYNDVFRSQVFVVTRQYSKVNESRPQTFPVPAITCSGMGPSMSCHIGVFSGDKKDLSKAKQIRTFTIEEIKRFSSFPDDFQLQGTFDQQWERVGNSVPPLMMKAIAEAIKTKIFDKIK